MEFIKKHIESVTLFALFLLCYILFFYKMGNYPLIDVDETRYVAIARDMLHVKDWMTLKLNGEFFFEKPPLYFWLENISFSIFRQITEATARIPVALTATFAVLMTYFSGKKIISRRFGFISSLILATSFEFLVLSRIAILDMLLATMVLASVLSGFLTFFVKEENKKFCWWGFYIFAALGVLAKGLPGVVLPFAIVFVSYLIAGRLKEIFKPIYILPGVILFFLIMLPWHINMLQTYGDLFYREYIYKHHLERFIDSKEIGRKEPFYFFFVVFTVGFLPWAASFIAMIISTFKSLIASIKDYFSGVKLFDYSEKWNKFDNSQKFIALNIIAFVLTFLFFSSSSTKLPTYILPAFAPAAVLLANYWYEYIYDNKHEKGVFISTVVLNSIFIIAAIAAVFTPLFLPELLQKEVDVFRGSTILLLFAIPTIGILAIIIKKKTVAFLANVFLMLGIIIIGVNHLFNFMCSFGENDLIKFAQKASTDNVKLATYDFGRRYSVWYYYGNHIDFQTENDIKWLRDYTKKNPNAYIIVKMKNMEDFDKEFKYLTIDTGKKYSLIRKL